MHLKIRHITTYRFEEPVLYGLQQLRTTPKSSRQQKVLRWSTVMEGGKHEVNFTDNYNNDVELISFDPDASTVIIRSEGDVEVEDNAGVVGRHVGPSPLWIYDHQTPLTKPGAGIRALTRKVEGENDVAKLHALSEIIGEAVVYKTGESESDWTAEEALAHGSGVCQDHSHIFLSAAREMGFPGRYVSGYLFMDGQVEQDATHAWAEVHVEGLGWVGFDVSNQQSPDDRYVRVATGLDYSEAAPVIGSRFGGEGESLDVRIEVAQQ